ncbi:MAG: hypothetical protein U0X20_17315 [Caldilineaceae bacterium]|jgi:hypothetical protein
MIPVYAIGNQRPAAVVVTKINSELLPAARQLLQLLIAAGIEWTANGMTEQMIVAETAGETKLEGMDTNDLRAVNQVFNGFLVYLNTPQEIVQRDGSTLVTKPQDVVMRYYHQQA